MMSTVSTIAVANAASTMVYSRQIPDSSNAGSSINQKRKGRF